MTPRRAIVLVVAVLLVAVLGARERAEGSSAQVMEERLVPALAFDGANYLVSWNMLTWQFGGEPSSQFGIEGARVDLGGHVLDPLPLTIAASTGQPRNSAIAYDGSNYLVAWSDGSAV